MRIGAFLRRALRILFVAVLGFVLGVVTTYVVLMASGPALEPWHTAQLDAEFTAALAADEVRTLDDYRQLEDRLFEEVADEVYAAVGTGSELQLVRYSAGSLADPRSRDVDWNRTFELTVDEPVGGVLLLHGMSDSPYSLRAVGELLHAQGHHVVGLRLPGHGTAPSGLTEVTWEDMAAAVRIGMRHLRDVVGDRPLHIVGYSNGAALALDHCLGVLEGSGEPMPESLVLLSPAIAVSAAAGLARWQSYLSELPGLERLAWTDVLPEYDPFKYNSFAVLAGYQVHALTGSVAARIEARAAAAPIEDLPPILVFLSAVDATVSADAVIDVLLQHFAPGRNELVLFDVNRAAVATPLLVADPGPLSERLMADDSLPFGLTLVTNESPESADVVAIGKAALSADTTTAPLGLAWPKGVLSLSHIALPFPPDDPLYGVRHPGDRGRLQLGQISVQGERGLLTVPPGILIRLRHNPFFDVVASRTVEWLARPEGSGGGR